MFAFVLMPFDPAFDDIYRLGIKEPTETLGIRAERVDEQISTKRTSLSESTVRSTPPISSLPT
jgi:hypothetical protein